MKQDRATIICHLKRANPATSSRLVSLFTGFSVQPPFKARIPATAMGILISCFAFWLSGCTGFTVNKSVQAGSNSAVLSSLTCSKSSMTGAGSVSCTIAISEPAPSAGVILGLSSSSAAVQVPQSVTIPATASRATFSATVSAVKSSESVTLTGTLNGLSSTFSLQLNPSGANLTISSSSISFGSVQLNTTATQSITLTSSGNAALTINSIAENGSGFSFSGVILPLTLTPGQTATLNVQFDPTSAASFTGQVTISSNSVTNATLQIALKGTGVTTPVAYQVALTWSPPTGSADPVSGYKVYRALGNSSTYQLLNAAVDSQAAFTDSSVATGNTYLYYVTSVDNSGVESVPSNVATIAIP